MPANPSFLILNPGVTFPLRHFSFCCRRTHTLTTLALLRTYSSSSSYATAKSNENVRSGRSGSISIPPPSTVDVVQKIDVNPPKGTRDFPPDEMRLRNWLFHNFRQVSQMFAFEEVDFPVLESEALFIRKAGEEIRDQLYCFEDRGNRRVALRPELTPSLARLVIQKGKSVSLPLKWFAVGQCWRYERMTRGRRREHYQWNMDIIGVPDVTAEAELISSIVTFFKRIGITASDVGFKISSRKVLQEVLQCYSIPDNLFGKVCIIIDKMEKIPIDEIKKELRSAELPHEAIEELLQVLSIKSLTKLEEKLGAAGEAVAELKRLFSLAEKFGYSEWIQFDASVVRGLAYYTGTVFEVMMMFSDEELQPDILRWKCQGSQSNYPSKMMKPFDDDTKSNLTEVVMSESICNFSEKSMITEDAVPDFALLKHGATRMTSSTGDQKTCLESQDSYVKLRIKSFTVPEFFVEIPETSTVGFLKRKIMEKATGIVGGSHVGVPLLGKKIGDENKTLSETAISNESRLDVILEPIPSHVPHSCPLQLPCDISQPLARCSSTPAVHQGTSDTSPDPLLCNSGNVIQGDHDLVEYQTNMLVGKNTASMEVIALPAISVEPLNMGPMHEKPNSSQNVQRRSSEFFSISEVEALVQEVEKLGTGRWKKIREQAFGNASNRTHTDLKDKWRSLVNTAKRPVNKRRGVVLPQELLDRVLAIETHNSRLQAI